MMEFQTVALFFPPTWGIYHPYIALPMLTATLRKHGIRVIQRDLNIEWYDEIISSSYLQDLEKQLSSMITKKDIPKEQVKLIASARAILPFVIERIDEAKINAKTLIKFLLKIRSVQYVRTALNCINATYYPTNISWDAYKSQYDCTRLSEVIKGALSIKDNVFRNYFQQKAEQLFSESPVSLIGISLTGEQQLIPTFTLAHVIKQINPAVPIVIGGGMLPYMRQALTKYPECFDFADYFVVGEGETALLRLCQSLGNNGELCNVPNLIYREKTSGKIKTTYTYVEDVDSLPIQDHDGLKMDLYCQPKVAAIQASRGCYWDRCAFCSLCGNYAHKYRERNMESVVDNIEYLLKKYSYNVITFSDECFSPARLRELVDALEKRRFGDKFIYVVLLRFEKGLDPDLFKRAYATGLRWISWGLESAHPETLRLMRKGISPETAELCLKHSNSCGIWNNVFTITDFPGVPDDDTKVTTDFTMRNMEYIDINYVTAFRLEGGTDIQKHPDKYNISIPKVDADYIGPRYSYYDKTHNRFCTHMPEMSESSEKIAKETVFASRMGPNWLTGVDIYYLVSYYKNGLLGKQAFRSMIQTRRDEFNRRQKLIDQIDSAVLWVPDYIKVIHISNKSSDGENNVVIRNNNTDGCMLTNTGTLQIMQCANRKIPFKTLVNQLANKANGAPRQHVEKEVREVCQKLIFFDYLEAKYE